MEKKEELSFEDALARLEEIVAKMEGGGLSLDETTSLYEEGVQLSVLCKAKLDITRKKVMLLVEENNGRKEVEFDDADE